MVSESMGRSGDGLGPGGFNGPGSGGLRMNGPPTPHVAYPYYTTRGPRDYFACNPGYPRN